MRKDNICICNVCGAKSSDDKNLVFVRAFKDTQEVDICTKCLPSVIHDSGEIVKTNEEISKI